MVTLARRWRDPFEPLLSRGLENLFDNQLASMFNDEVAAPWGMDVRQDDDHYYIDAELPGFEVKDVDVSLESGILTIKAEREDRKEEKGEVLRRERRWSKFFRSVQLPGLVDEKNVEAHLENGVLKVTLDRRNGAKPRKIEIQAGNAGATVLPAK